MALKGFLMLSEGSAGVCGPTVGVTTFDTVDSVLAEGNLSGGGNLLSFPLSLIDMNQLVSCFHLFVSLSNQAQKVQQA